MNRMEVIFCKRRLGTASDWDEGNDLFKVEVEDGGTELTSGPLVSYLATLPRLP